MGEGSTGGPVAPPSPTVSEQLTVDVLVYNRPVARGSN